MMDEAELGATTRFAYEVGHLSRCVRAGWQLAGVTVPESVAEHSHRVSVLAWVVAFLEGWDAARAAVLGMLHDLPETRTTDLSSVAKEHVLPDGPGWVADAQSTAFPEPLRDAYRAAINEFEDYGTTEARCARDADRLDCLLRAREYQEQQGNTLIQPFVDNMLEGLTTATGRALGERAAKTSPSAWWIDVASVYGLPAV